jgi:hypothetical protein
MSASGLLSDVSGKVLNSTEDAHIETESIFEPEEHLQGLTPVHCFLRDADRSAVGQPRQKA